MQRFFKLFFLFNFLFTIFFLAYYAAFSVRTNKFVLMIRTKETSILKNGDYLSHIFITSLSDKVFQFFFHLTDYIPFTHRIFYLVNQRSNYIDNQLVKSIKND